MRSDLLDAERRSRLRRRAVAVAVVVVASASAAVAVFLPLGKPAVEKPPTADAGSVAAPVAASSPPPLSPLRTRPLAAWLGDVARDSGRDLVLSPDLRGDLTASDSSHLDWRERLAAYARVAGFEFSVSDGLIEAHRRDGAEAALPRRGRRAGDDAEAVAPQKEPSAAAPTLPLTPLPPAAPSAAEAAAAAKADARTRVVRLAHAAAKDVATALVRTGEGLGATVTADATSNALVLTGPEAALGRLLAVVAELDRPRRRVLLEAKIVEVTHSARLDLGVEWKVTGTVGSDLKFPPKVSDAGSAALVVATGGASALDARISALEAGGKLHVVSRPSVVMLEGSPATIESVRILRIRLPGRGAVVGDEVVEAPASGRATEDIPVGVRLEVTPAIRDGSRVSLRIKAKSSSLGAPLPPDDIPEELSRMVDAEVLVRSGETAVLGGLSREAATKSGAGVPVLRSIPGLGVLFGKSARSREDEELLVLVTPRLLD